MYPLANGESWLYRFTQPPEESGKACRLENGSGVINSANFENVLISCSDAHTIGGTVTGLTEGSVTLENKVPLGVADTGNELLAINASGEFSFNLKHASLRLPEKQVEALLLQMELIGQRNGENSQDYATALLSLASAREKMGDYPAAFASNEKTLKIALRLDNQGLAAESIIKQDFFTI